LLPAPAFHVGYRDERGREHARAEGDDAGGERVSLSLAGDGLRRVTYRAGHVLCRRADLAGDV